MTEERVLRGNCRGRIALLAAATLLCAVAGSPAAEPATLKIGGTGGSIGTMERMADAFRQRHPGVTVSIIRGLGTRGGINAVLKGALDVGLAGRPLSQQELGQGLEHAEYALSPFVFATHERAAGVDLTPDAIARIYRGETKIWPDGTPLRLILRQEADVDTIMLRAISPAIGEAVGQALERPGMAMAMDDQENCDMIERIRGAFGTSTLTQIVSEGRSLTLLSVNGVPPRIDTTASGRYPYFKRFHLVTGPLSSPLAREFVAFVRSPAGAEILAQTGHLVPGAR